MHRDKAGTETLHEMAETNKIPTMTEKVSSPSSPSSPSYPIQAAA